MAIFAGIDQGGVSLDLLSKLIAGFFFGSASYDLDGHRQLRLHMGGSPDRPHASFIDLFDDPKGAECSRQTHKTSVVLSDPTGPCVAQFGERYKPLPCRPT